MRTPQHLEFSGRLVAGVKRLAELNKVCVGLGLHLELESGVHGSGTAGRRMWGPIAVLHLSPSKQ